MHTPPFRLWHSVAGLGALVLVQAIAVHFVPQLGAALALCASAAATPFLLYLSTEVIAEIHLARRMLLFLSVVVAEFVSFFAFEYALLLAASPASFPSLPHDPIALLLHSLMVLVFNPLYLPASGLGRALLLINTLGALVLVLFILQNIHSFRHRQDTPAI
jgi:hypothetical protein